VKELASSILCKWVPYEVVNVRMITSLFKMEAVSPENLRGRRILMSGWLWFAKPPCRGKLF
jgi:hypothetical protein